MVCGQADEGANAVKTETWTKPSFLRADMDGTDFRDLYLIKIAFLVWENSPAWKRMK